MWCIPNLNPEYIQRMENILNLYEKNYSFNEPVICIDEKPVMLHENKRPVLPMKPGKVKRRDYEYKRQGSCNVFCAVEPKTGVYMNKVTSRRTKETFALFLKDIEKNYNSASTIHIVLDNLNIHFKSSVLDTFGETEGNKLWNRFLFHYTPKHASWLNQAEIAISMFSRQCLGKRRIKSIEKLSMVTAKWNNAINTKRVTIDWKFTVGDAKKKFYY